jgi:hypothetical protein
MTWPVRLTVPQLLLVCEVLYFIKIYTIKISLLYLYRRIFPQQWFCRIPYCDDDCLGSGMSIAVHTASQDVGYDRVRTLHWVRKIRAGHVVHQHLH